MRRRTSQSAIEREQREAAEQRHRHEHQSVATQTLRFGQQGREEVRQREVEVVALAAFMPAELATRPESAVTGPRTVAPQ
jgi:hypothetical protein